MEPWRSAVRAKVRSRRWCDLSHRLLGCYRGRCGQGSRLGAESSSRRLLMSLSQRRAEPFNLAITPIEPVRTPDAVEMPSLVLQHLLPQPVPLPAQSALWYVAPSPLHRQNVLRWSLRMPHSEVDPESRTAYLMVDQMAKSVNGLRDILLKGTVGA